MMAAPAGMVLVPASRAAETASRLGVAMLEAARTPVFRQETVKTWVDEAGNPVARKREFGLPAWALVAGLLGGAAIAGRGLRTGVLTPSVAQVPTRVPNPEYEAWLRLSSDPALQKIAYPSGAPPKTTTVLVPRPHLALRGRSNVAPYSPFFQGGGVLGGVPAVIDEFPVASTIAFLLNPLRAVRDR